MEDATRTFGKGSCPPGPVPEGLIRVYSMRFCPFAHRTRLVLRAKGIRHEVININLRNKPEWYYTKHPFGQIPVLENSKCQLIYESVIACEYLDDAYPGRKLYPYDPYERARQKMLLELFYKVPHLTKECLVAIRCGRECADLKLALRQEFCNLEEVFPVVISSTAFTNRKSSTPSGEMENIHLFFSPTIHHFKDSWLSEHRLLWWRLYIHDRLPLLALV
ncbi:glutathione S-transferase omega-2 isoform X3 [Leopardus geoffroyi]|uniref:glutathione S-transferase omega-2 isoform X3 n=1 Tax=Leopardus geoffroyi TaxID=46844 RepID=UPI00090559B5|nr:glutathione S-transferase omega-2 isoform X3 [Leopardus geoffroyi]